MIHPSGRCGISIFERKAASSNPISMPMSTSSRRTYSRRHREAQAGNCFCRTQWHVKREDILMSYDFPIQFDVPQYISCLQRSTRRELPVHSSTYANVCHFYTSLYLHQLDSPCFVSAKNKTQFASRDALSAHQNS